MRTNDTIRDYISKEILHGSAKTPLNDQDQLIESGIIDSLGIMTLLSFLEDRFAIQIPSEDLMPENFSSISTICALVDRQLEK